jgi:hypothetical protein
MSEDGAKYYADRARLLHFELDEKEQPKILNGQPLPLYPQDAATMPIYHIPRGAPPVGSLAYETMLRFRRNLISLAPHLIGCALARGMALTIEDISGIRAGISITNGSSNNIAGELTPRERNTGYLTRLDIEALAPEELDAVSWGNVTRRGECRSFSYEIFNFLGVLMLARAHIDTSHGISNAGAGANQGIYTGCSVLAFVRPDNHRIQCQKGELSISDQEFFLGTNKQFLKTTLQQGSGAYE